MRKIAAFLCVVATLFSFCACQNNYTHGIYEMTITASMISNNCVGNDWKCVYTNDGKTIKSGEQWTVSLHITKTVVIDATITELDKSPDVGFGSMSVVLRDNFETSSIITVTESKGRYKGNSAQWKINYKVNLIEKFRQ